MGERNGEQRFDVVRAPTFERIQPCGPSQIRVGRKKGRLGDMTAFEVLKVAIGLAEIIKEGERGETCAPNIREFLVARKRRQSQPCIG